MKTVLSILLLLLPLIYLQAQPAAWERMELKGTGLTIESPKSFDLVQDKPDPFLEHQTAYILWRLSFEKVFATVTYEKVKRDLKTPRQKMDETATLFAGQNKPTISRVTDTTFDGRSAALFEEEFFEPYAKKNMHRKMLAFGPAGEITTVNLSWPIDDPAAKTIAERIFSSIQMAGAVAVEISKMPPADWKKLAIEGLYYETPTTARNEDCITINSSNVTRRSESRCYLWGKDFYIKVEYWEYIPGRTISPAEMLRDRSRRMAEIDSKSTLKTTKESRTIPITVPGAEAARLQTATGYGTVAGIVDNIFIRKGNNVWEVNIIRPVRWDFAVAAADRIVASLTTEIVTNTKQPITPPAPGGARGFYDRAVIYYASNDLKKAESDLNEAIRRDPKMADAYILRARVFCLQRLIMSAIHDEDKAIELGAKLDYRCGRSPGPVPK